ncbi:barstar family protein, partial [Actinoplanes sp. NPDC051411]|uniref:barstar family protein n=1 Tax=Actinoplanes sp. NPDC051411 TaxID=3155522 RepID=UPI0034495E9A
MATDGDALPVLLIDGANFSDFDGFAREFSKLLHHYTWRGNLDAFNDILRGGFGTPENGWILRWQNSALFRAALGYEATTRPLEQISPPHTPAAYRPAQQIHDEPAGSAESPAPADRGKRNRHGLCPQDPPPRPARVRTQMSSDQKRGSQTTNPSGDRKSPAGTQIRETNDAAAGKTTRVSRGGGATITKNYYLNHGG